jgi:hypothetical protein
MTSDLIDAIHTRIHPLFQQIVLVDCHVENRLNEMTEIEKNFQKEFGHTLFLHCDMEDRLVHYEITSLDMTVSCGFDVK